MYTQALDESLRLIDIAQREYDEAVEDGDEIMMSQKRKELDYCLSCLKFSTVLVATEGEELIISSYFHYYPVFIDGVYSPDHITIIIRLKRIIVNDPSH